MYVCDGCCLGVYVSREWEGEFGGRPRSLTPNSSLGILLSLYHQMSDQLYSSLPPSGQISNSHICLLLQMEDAILHV